MEKNEDEYRIRKKQGGSGHTSYFKLLSWYSCGETDINHTKSQERWP
jgi:hypothetical protein